MALYKYLRDSWKDNSKRGYGNIWNTRLIKWRRENSVLQIERPTRLDRARSLGYKAKEGILVARVRVERGGRLREMFKNGRKSSNLRRKKIVEKNYQSIAEERANKKFHNFEVLNSYYVAEDGRFKWYEVVLVDVNHPAIVHDKDLSWICAPQHNGRVFRGLTSSAKKSRGLRIKGKGAEKTRPSYNAYLNKKWKGKSKFKG